MQMHFFLTMNYLNGEVSKVDFPIFYPGVWETM